MAIHAGIDPEKTGRGPRIGFFCNMNNNFFSIARYLRDRGADAWVLSFEQEDSHFHPSCDTVDEEHKSFFVELPWNKRYLFKATEAEIRQTLDAFDIIVGCGFAPAFFAKGGRPADILIPFGGDVADVPYRKTLNFRKIRKSIRDRRTAALQIQGIREAKAVLTEKMVYGKFITDLDFDGPIIDSHFPAVYDYTDKLLSDPNIAATDFARRIRDIRGRSDFIVFHHARHIWKTYIDELCVKDNHQLIEGFASFLRSGTIDSAKLILFEYGPDVGHSRELIRQLSIEDHVEWFPLSPRKLILYGLLHSDVATGHFGVACDLNGVTQEALVCGKPLLHSRFDTRHDAATVAALYSVYDVHNATQIAGALRELYENPGKRKVIGQANRRWYREQFVGEFFESFWAALEAPEHLAKTA